MQMIFNPGGGAAVGPNKSENLDDGPVAPASPWANLLSVGLKILTAILGGGGAATQSDGIDKVDNGGSPLQVSSSLFGDFYCILPFNNKVKFCIKKILIVQNF